MKIAIGCDDAGLLLKDVVINHIEKHGGIEVVDFGYNDEEGEYYPDIAERVADAISKQQAERGILICGTGIGMAITANKIPGIRAALCHDVYSAERSRKSNNAQVMTMGSRVIGPEHAKMIVGVWLQSEFDESSRSGPKVKRMNEIDDKYRKT